MTHHRVDHDYARALDREDALASYRSRFHIPQTTRGDESIYFCGNSLGLQPKSVRRHVDAVLDAWADRGVEGHFHGDEAWVTYQDRLNAQMAGIVGAQPSEVAVMNALTVNLHLMLVSFYRPTSSRYKIVIENSAFPSDRYAVQSHITLHGYNPADALVELRGRPGEMTLHIEEIEDFFRREGASVALVLVGGVNYYTGQAFDLERITKAAHATGCVVGFDLAHAAGNVPLALHNWDVDFAAWCSYKYLNAGPGSPGGIFVHERHARRTDLHRFAGWWGEEPATRFAMGPVFEPMPGAKGWQVSNPPLLSMAALRASLDLFDEAGFVPLRRKSEQMTAYLEFLLDDLCRGSGHIITPREPSARGAQLSLDLGNKGRAVFEQLLVRGVVCDWRDPTVIRLAPVPFYNTYEEVYRCAEHLREVLGTTA